MKCIERVAPVIFATIKVWSDYWAWALKILRVDNRDEAIMLMKNSAHYAIPQCSRGCPIMLLMIPIMLTKNHVKMFTEHNARVSVLNEM